MITALIWGLAFVLMCAFLGGAALGSVVLIERGHSKRTAEEEKTKRIAMENAWQLESAKLLHSQPALGTSFDLKETL